MGGRIFRQYVHELMKKGIWIVRWSVHLVLLCGYRELRLLYDGSLDFLERIVSDVLVPSSGGVLVAHGCMFCVFAFGRNSFGLQSHSSKEIGQVVSFVR